MSKKSIFYSRAIIRRLFLMLAVAAGLICPALGQISRPSGSLNLDGTWQFQLDPEDTGVAEGWFAAPGRITGRIQVPGCWQAQGFGAPLGVQRHYYEGAAWYARQVQVPAGWQGKKIFLLIGGAFTYTTAWVNGLPVGSHEGFSTPFHLDVTAEMKPGAENRIALRVANVRDALRPMRRDLGQRDTSEPTGALNYGALWGGIYRGVSLEARNAARIEHTAISTTIGKPMARLAVTLRNNSASLLDAASLEVRIAPPGGAEIGRGSATLRLAAGTSQVIEVAVSAPAAKLWSPESPQLYQAVITLGQGGRVLDEQRQTFGFREVRAEATRLLLNGKPVYLRGYGDDSAEVLTGAPPADKQTYLRRMRAAKELGFNAVRFHSTTPTGECFEAADETGLLVLAELPVVYQEYLLPHKDFLRNELLRIIRAYRNHPSWFLFTLGNEFGLHRIPDQRGKEVFLQTVDEFVRLAKSANPGLLVSSNTGYLVPPLDVAIPYQGFSLDKPNLKHEYGGYRCTLPDPSLIPKYTGVFEPLWLEREKKWIDAAGFGPAWQQYLESSRRLYANGVKANIEKLRSLPEFTGYFYWLINDFPGGTPEGPEWNWGWLDPFFEPKAVTTAEGREWNSAVLPLISTGIDSRTFWMEDGKTLPVLISNYGGSAISGAKLEWELRRGETRLAAGVFDLPPLPEGAVTAAGNIRIAAEPLAEASQFELIATVRARSGSFTNRWKLWGFPRHGLMRTADVGVVSLVKSASLRRYFPFVRERSAADPPGGVLIASSFEQRVVEFLRAGGRVLLLAEPGRFGGRISYFPDPGGALGIPLPANHPMLGGFPQAGFADLQFYNLLERATEMASPAGVQPVISGVRLMRGAGTNNLSRVLFAYEAKAGAGKLLVTSFNIRPNLDDAVPEAVYLLDRMLRYVTGSAFQPTATLSDTSIDEIRVPYTEMIH